MWSLEKMSDSQEKIRVGVVGRAHGVRGEIRVFTDDENSDCLLRMKTVYLGDEMRAYSVIHATRCARFIALELEGVDDRDKAFELTGLEVRVDRSKLRPLRNAFYACDLVGLSICDEAGKNWGTVTSVMPSGAHELLQYKRIEGGTGLIPFVAAHVGQIDLEAGTVCVDAEWMHELDGVFGE